MAEVAPLQLERGKAAFLAVSCLKSLDRMTGADLGFLEGEGRGGGGDTTQHCQGFYVQ